jgi:hypothetical protein
MLLFRSRGNRLGYRGWAVIHLALVWLILGLSMLQPPPLRAQAEALEGHHSSLLIANLPVAVQVGMWALPALVALAFARSNPKRSRDRISFEALVVPPAICFFSFAWAIIYNLLVHHHFITIYVENLAVQGFLLSLTLILSYWPEPSPKGIVR